MIPDSLQLVNSMLLPGILIIASAILLFSMNDKYTLIVNRIRLLKEERHDLNCNKPGEKEYQRKMNNIDLQLMHLIHRIAMTRITIVSYSVAILFFSVGAILLAIRSSFVINGYFWIILGFLFAGLLAVINGVVFAVIEMFKGYRIVHIEIADQAYEK